MGTAGKVLVVDDYEPNLRGLSGLLEAAGYSVWSASNGTDALRMVSDHAPDLVLLDVVMPGKSGLEVCQELKRNPATCLTPIVLISATQDRKRRIAGLQIGADDFLNKPIDPEELRARVHSLMRMKHLTDELESAKSLFFMLGRIVEARDPYTDGHCERLARYATALGTDLNFGRRDLDILYRGAFLHDLGKIAIPDEVLLKKGQLTRSEYELMKRHPVIGDELCGTLRSLEDVRLIVRFHHERLDGRGYPDGLSGEAIPLLAQIVSVVDVFDALTTDRPYRQAFTPTVAYRMLLDEARAGWRTESLVTRFIELHRADGVLTTSSAQTKSPGVERPE